MKLSSLLLLGALGLNAVLLTVYLRRPASPAEVNVIPVAAPASERSATVATAAKSAAPASPSAAPSTSTNTWAKFNSPDLRTLAARLRAAGFSPALVNSVIRAQIAEKMEARAEQLAAGVEEKPFWIADGTFNTPIDAKTRAALQELNRESNEMFKAAVGPDGAATGAAGNEGLIRRYGNIPPEKIDQLQRVESDYNELRNQVSTSARGLMLPEDREKLTLLEFEKRADLAKVLTPSELDDYLLHTSTTTSRLRAALTTMNASEEEFRAIFKAQLAFDEKYANNNVGTTYFTAETAKERQDAQARIAEEVKLALSPERFAEYTRSSDRDYQTLSRIAQQANLPAAVATQVFDLRDAVSKESNRIFADAALNVDQKRAALQTLAQSTRSQITSALGDSNARSYLQSNLWLSRVEQGAAVTFMPGGGTSTKNLPPPRPASVPGPNPPPALPATPTINVRVP